jgi:peptidoglycan/LPS O-acetylase OafA/YrhL
MPEQTLFERYQEHRARRFLVRSEKTETMLPRWRTRSRRRILVVALGVTFVLMLAIGVLCHFFERAPLLWLPACLVFFPIWFSLSIVSGRLGDAPADALDEWEIQQRNAARSIGLSITQWLVMIPVTYLVVGSSVTDGSHTTMAYAGGLLTLTTLLIGGCSPTMILAWSRPDPYPDQSHPTTDNDRLEAP